MAKKLEVDSARADVPAQNLHLVKPQVTSEEAFMTLLASGMSPGRGVYITGVDRPVLDERQNLERTERLIRRMEDATRATLSRATREDPSPFVGDPKESASPDGTSKSS